MSKNKLKLLNIRRRRLINKRHNCWILTIVLFLKALQKTKVSFEGAEQTTQTWRKYITFLEAYIWKKKENFLLLSASVFEKWLKQQPSISTLIQHQALPGEGNSCKTRTRSNRAETFPVERKLWKLQQQHQNKNLKPGEDVSCFFEEKADPWIQQKERNKFLHKKNEWSEKRWWWESSCE